MERECWLVIELDAKIICPPISSTELEAMRPL